MTLTMPTLSSSTTLTLPAGQAYVFERGSGVGTVIADPGGRQAGYNIGPQDTVVGPFTTAVSLVVTIVSGSVSYRVDSTPDEQVDQLPALAAVNARLDGRLPKKDVPQNYVSGSLNRFRKLKSNVRAGLASGSVAFAGTSLLMGAYSAGIAATNGSRPNGPNVRVAQILSAAGIPCESRSFIGNGYVLGQAGNTFQYFDSRLTVTGGWTPNQTIGFTAGGHPLRGGSSGSISFSFTGAADQIVIYEIQSNAFATGVYSVDIDGSTVVSAAQTTLLATNSVRKVTLPFSAVGAGSHTLNINWVSGTPAILGAEVNLTTGKYIKCLNVCAGSSSSSDWARPQYSGAATFVVPSIIAPDLVLFDIGANDWIGGASVSSFRANVATALAGFKIASDVIALTPFPTSDASVSRSVQQQYVDALIAECVAAGVPYIDIWNDVGTWESMNVSGKPALCDDPYHPGIGASWEYPDRIAAVLQYV